MREIFGLASAAAATLAPSMVDVTACLQSPDAALREYVFTEFLPRAKSSGQAAKVTQMRTALTSCRRGPSRCVVRTRDTTRS